MVVDVGEAEQVADDFALGVVAMVFAHRADARQTERHDLLGLPRRQVTLEINEVAAEVARDPARERVLVLARRIGELADPVERVLEVTRIADDRVDRGADRERLAVAVGQRAAMRGDLYRAQMAVVRLRREELLVDELQVEDSALECRRAEREQREQHRSAPTHALDLLRWRRLPHRPLTSVTRRRRVARRPDSSGGGARVRAIRSAGAWPRCSARSAAGPSRSGSGPARG